MIMPASLNRSNCAFHRGLRRLATTPTAKSGLKPRALIARHIAAKKLEKSNAVIIYQRKQTDKIRQHYRCINHYLSWH
jgi:hypothetical protein